MIKRGKSRINLSFITACAIILSSSFLLFSCKGAISSYQDMRSIIYGVIDNIPPTVERVTAPAHTTVRVVFSEEVSADTAENIDNYSIQGDTLVNIESARILSDPTIVDLTVSAGMKHGWTYQITIHDIADMKGNVMNSVVRNFNGRGYIVADLFNTPDALTTEPDINIDVMVDGNGDGLPDPGDTGFYKYKLDNGGWSETISETEMIAEVDLTLDGEEGYHVLKVIGGTASGQWQGWDEPTIFKWKIDRKRPTMDDLIVTNLPDSITSLTITNISVSGNGIVQYQYRVEGDGFDNQWSDPQPLGNNIALSGLIGDPQTEYIIQIIGRDQAGNWQEDPPFYTYTWKVDSTQPIALLYDKPDLYENNDSINIGVGGTNITHYKFRIDSDALSDWISVSQRITASGLGEGSHAIEVYARDAEDNEQIDATTYTWNVDMTPPTAADIELSNLPNDPTCNRFANIIVDEAPAVDGDVYYYRYKLDDNAWSGRYYVSTDISLTKYDLEDEGTHTVYVIAIDRAGNEMAIPSTLPGDSAWYSWTIDTTSVATAELSNTPALRTNSQETDIVVEGTGVTGYMYKLDDGIWSEEFTAGAAGDHISHADLTEGTHTVSVIASNAAGNWQSFSSPTTYSWEIDITAPVAVLSSLPVDGTIYNYTNIDVANTAVSGETVDAYKYRYKIDGGAWIGGDANGWSAERAVSQNIQLAGLLENTTYVIEVIACDEVGNWQGEAAVPNPADPTSYTWYISEVDFPIATLVDPPSGTTGSTNLSAEVSSTNGVTHYKYKVDEGAWSSETSIAVVISESGLSEGPHTLCVAGYDGLMWQPEANASEFTWNIDLTPPESVTITMTSPDPAVADGGTTDEQDFSFTVSGTDVTHYQYRLNSGAWQAETAVSTEISLTGLTGDPATTYVLDVKGRDEYGNWMDDDDAAIYTWTVDNEAPPAPAVNDEGDSDTDTSIDFSWTFDDADDVSDVRVQVATDSSFSDVVYGGTNGISIGKVTSFSYDADPADGSKYYARVRVCDAYDNWSDFGTASDGIDIVGHIHGLVVDGLDTSEGLSGAEVSITDNLGIELERSVTSGADGEFEFTNMPIGANRYRISATLSGYNNAVKNNVTVSQGVSIDIGSIYMISVDATSSSITGQVIDANWGLTSGHEIDEATVEIINYNGDFADTQSVDSDGNFTTGTLNPGTYSVLVTKAGYFDLTVDNVVVDGRIDDPIDIGYLAICEQLAPYQIRVTVQWGENPQDLDLHVVGPSNHLVREYTGTTWPYYSTGNTGTTNYRFHVFYKNQKNFYEPDDDYPDYYPQLGSGNGSGDPNGSSSTTSLVQDTTTGFGPEAINIFKIADEEEYAGGSYTFSVHDYSQTSWYASSIVMRVYNENGLVRQIEFPGGGESYTMWKAIKINVSGPDEVISVDDITVYNQFSSLSISDDEHKDKDLLDW